VAATKQLTKPVGVDIYWIDGMQPSGKALCGYDGTGGICASHGNRILFDQKLELELEVEVEIELELEIEGTCRICICQQERTS
jgi:hypothetical protein